MTKIRGHTGKVGSGPGTSTGGTQDLRPPKWDLGP